MNSEPAKDSMMNNDPAKDSMTNSKAAKDFNALLQEWIEDGRGQEWQVQRVRSLLRGSWTLVEEVCADVQQPGLTPGELEAVRTVALDMVAALEDKVYADYSGRLAKLMGVQQRELDRSRSARRKDEKKQEKQPQ